VVRAEDSVGNMDSNTIELNTVPGNLLPCAQFSYSPLSPTQDELVVFMDNSSDSDGYLVNWT